MSAEELMGKDKHFILVHKNVICNFIKKLRVFLPFIDPYVDLSSTSNKDIYSCLLEQKVGFTNRDRAFLSYIDPSFLSKLSSHIIDIGAVTHGAYTSQLLSSEIDQISFDSVELLESLHNDYPRARLYLKISTNAINKQVFLTVEESMDLLKKAKELNMNVEGIAIYYTTDDSFDALDYLKRLFAECEKAQYTFKRVHFFGSDFSKLVEDKERRETLLNTLLTFPQNISYSGEASQYLLSNCCTIATKIIGKKAKKSDEGVRTLMYYLDDGVYTSFFCVKLDNAQLCPKPVRVKSVGKYDDSVRYTTTIWGPTCDSIDCLGDNFKLPELDIDDWIFFEGAGCQCTTMSTGFNGMADPDSFFNN